MTPTRQGDDARVTISEERLRELRAGYAKAVEMRTDALINGNRRVDLTGITQRCIDTIAVIDAELSRRSQGNDAAGDDPKATDPQPVLELWHRFAQGSVQGYAMTYDGFRKAYEALTTPTASPDVRAQGEVPNGVLGYMYRRVNGPTYFSLPDPRPLANTDIAPLEWFTPVCALLQRQSDTEPKAEDAWQTIESAPRDGTAVFCFWTPRSNVKVHAGCYGAARWLGHEWVNPEDDEDSYLEPTHWQPLPAPPKRTDARKESNK